ncbi:MAG: hypothetical protein IJO74_02765 [Clostridia bacterium]|nr:hypothetical protein [Clostridia bacterium]
MKRIVSVALCIVLLISLSSCSDGNTGQPVLSYGEQSLSANIFTFLLSQTKTMSLMSIGQMSDSVEFWDTPSGMVMAEYIMNDTISTAMSLAYYADCAVKSGFVIEKEDEKLIKSAVDTMMEGYGMTKQEFNVYMSQFGMDYNSLADYYRLQTLATYGKTLVLGEGGTYPITDDDCLEYYKENYVTLRHINLNNINKVEANGKTIPLTEQEKAQVNAQADDIQKALEEGHDITEFASLSTDKTIQLYPAGVTIPVTDVLYELASAWGESKNQEFNAFELYWYLLNSVEGFAEFILGAEQNQIKRLDTTSGIFFLEKLPLDMEMYEVFKGVIYNGGAVEPEKTKALMKELEPEFVIDTLVLNSFTVKGAAVMPISAN